VHQYSFESFRLVGASNFLNRWSAASEGIGGVIRVGHQPTIAHVEKPTEREGAWSFEYSPNSYL